MECGKSQKCGGRLKEAVLRRGKLDMVSSDVYAKSWNEL